MIIAIVGLILGLVIVLVGWMIYCGQSLGDYPPSQTEIDLLRKEADEANAEDQPLKWMNVADAEAEFRASRTPRIKWGKGVIALGIVLTLVSIISLFRY